MDSLRCKLLASWCVLWTCGLVNLTWAQTQPGAAQPPRATQPANAGQAQATPRAPQAPFQLSPQEQAELAELLQRWEAQSSKVNNLHCLFTLWDYNLVFKNIVQRAGELRFERPDRGMYHEKYLMVKQGDKQQWQPTPGEHWTCDGKSIYEFKYDDQVLIEHQLPRELQGEGIQHGPLPFIFLARADHLTKRYWIRDITTEKERKKGEIWLEIFPRYQQDAANFIKVELILKAESFLPYGLKLYNPNGKSHRTYVFTKYEMNQNQWFGGMDWSPAPPRGWQKKVEKALAPASAPQRRPTGNGGLFDKFFKNGSDE